MMFKSINVICDASPKAFREVPRQKQLHDLGASPACTFHQVWVPVLSAGECAAAWSIQQLSDLMRSEVADDVKLQEAEKVIDSMASKFVEQDKEKAKSKMLPACCLCLIARTSYMTLFSGSA